MCRGDGGAPLSILLADPQGSQDGAANIEWVLTLRESNALDLQLCWMLGCDLSSWQQCLGTWWCHRLHCFGIQALADAHITLHGGVEGSLMDATALHAQEGGLEDHLWTLESLIADGDHYP